MLASSSLCGRSGLIGGGDRTRTDDPYVANVVLYQLSYTPGSTGWYQAGRALSR